MSDHQDIERRVSALELSTIRLGPRRETEEEQLYKANELFKIILAATEKFKEKKMVRCKVVCNWKQKNQNDDGVAIVFSAVTSGSEENKEFFKFTPGGTFQFYTVNKTAAEQFELGKEYYMDFSPAEIHT